MWEWGNGMWVLWGGTGVRMGMSPMAFAIRICVVIFGGTTETISFTVGGVKGAQKYCVGVLRLFICCGLVVNSFEKCQCV